MIIPFSLRSERQLRTRSPWAGCMTTPAVDESHPKHAMRGRNSYMSISLFCSECFPKIRSRPTIKRCKGHNLTPRTGGGRTVIASNGFFESKRVNGSQHFEGPENRQPIKLHNTRHKVTTTAILQRLAFTMAGGIDDTIMIARPSLRPCHLRLSRKASNNSLRHTLRIMSCSERQHVGRASFLTTI